MPQVAVESKRELAKAKTRHALLKSALQLYSCEGAQGMSMNKVAKGAGIAQPSFYNHFDSLDTLQSELSEQLKSNYLSPMRQAWISMLSDFNSLTQEQFTQQCEKCLAMIFDSAFQNIALFKHLIEDRPRFNAIKKAKGKSSENKGLGNLIPEIQEEWSEIFTQGLVLSGLKFEISNVNLCVDIASAQVHELILGCHQNRYTRQQAISILSMNFNGLFINLFASKK
jgi:TetR/AcrR family transcriptional regulator of autoinduction and epiphytic fitness